MKGIVGFACSRGSANAAAQRVVDTFDRPGRYISVAYLGVKLFASSSAGYLRVYKNPESPAKEVRLRWVFRLQASAFIPGVSLWHVDLTRNVRAVKVNCVVIFYKTRPQLETGSRAGGRKADLCRSRLREDFDRRSATVNVEEDGKVSGDGNSVR